MRGDPHKTTLGRLDSISALLADARSETARALREADNWRNSHALQQRNTVAFKTELDAARAALREIAQGDEPAAAARAREALRDV